MQIVHLKNQRKRDMSRCSILRSLVCSVILCGVIAGTMSLSLTGCRQKPPSGIITEITGGSKDQTFDYDSDRDNAPAAEPEHYSFSVFDLQTTEKGRLPVLYPGMELSENDAVALLGSMYSSFEAPSCALSGVDQILTYSGYELTLHCEDGHSVLTSIRLTDDSHTTEEGIYIGETVTELFSVYGEPNSDSAESNSTELNSGEYCYTKGNTELSFVTRTRSIISIEYRLK